MHFHLRIGPRSARVSRAGSGVSPESSELLSARRVCSSKELTTTVTPSPKPKSIEGLR